MDTKTNKKITTCETSNAKAKNISNIKEITIKSFDGTKIFYIYAKQKRDHTIIFLHGLGGNWTEWKDEIDFMLCKGYSTIGIDLRGHGLSSIPKTLKGYKFENFAKDINYILKSEGIKNFSLVGHSLGGGVAIVYCELFKKKLPKSIVLIESAARYPYKKDHELNINPFITHILKFIAKNEKFKREFTPHIEYDLTELKRKTKINVILHALKYTPLKCIYAILSAVHDYSLKNEEKIKNMLLHIKIPALVITGTEDKTIPIEYSVELHNLIKKSKLKLIKGVHHLLPLEEPKKLGQEILNFIKKIR